MKADAFCWGDCGEEQESNNNGKIFEGPTVKKNAVSVMGYRYMDVTLRSILNNGEFNRH